MTHPHPHPHPRFQKAQSGLFVPSQLSECKFWYDSRQGLLSDPIESWTPRAGSIVLAESAGSRPAVATISGVQCVDVDVGEALVNEDAATKAAMKFLHDATGMTLFVLMRWDASHSGVYHLGTTISSGSAGVFLITSATAPNPVSFRVRRSGGYYAQINIEATPPAPGTVVLYSFSQSGAGDLVGRKNGVSIANGSVSGTANSADADFGFGIGRCSAAKDTNATFCQALGFSALTTAKHNAVGNYLCKILGLTWTAI